MVLGKRRVPLQGVRRPLTPSSGQGPPGPRPSPTRCQRRLHVGVKPHVCSRAQAFWKSPARSGLEKPVQRWARQLPGAGCCWQSNQCSSLPNILFSKQHLHAKRGADWNIRGLVSWQPAGRQCLSPELCSPSCLTRPATSLGCCGNAYIFPKRKARQDKLTSQPKYNPGTETSASLLDLFYATCFWKSLSYIWNKIKLSRICNEQIIRLIKYLHLSLKVWNILAWHPTTGNENK